MFDNKTKLYDQRAYHLHRLMSILDPSTHYCRCQEQEIKHHQTLPRKFECLKRMRMGAMGCQAHPWPRTQGLNYRTMEVLTRGIIPMSAKQIEVVLSWQLSTSLRDMIGTYATIARTKLPNLVVVTCSTRSDWLCSLHKVTKQSVSAWVLCCKIF